MCKDCVLSYSSNKKGDIEMNCNVCEKIFERKDLIELKESGSAYAFHSKVEATIQKPTF